MLTCTIITGVIWCLFFAFMNRERAGDYGVNVVPFFQFMIAAIVTLLVWLFYFSIFA